MLVHGFTQTNRCWGGLPGSLAAEFEVTAVDAPGHGDSSSISAALPETADLLVASGGRATYVGYSMGGRMALHVALAHPDAVERLVLVSATPGIDDDAERAARRERDEHLADHIEAIGVDAFLDEWLSQPMFAELGPTDRDLDERRRNTAAGLADSLRRAGTGTQEPLWDRLSELSMPVLLVTGSLDDRFSAIAGRVVERIGDNARWVILSGGHTVHRTSPAFEGTLRGWLAGTA